MGAGGRKKRLCLLCVVVSIGHAKPNPTERANERAHPTFLPSFLPSIPIPTCLDAAPIDQEGGLLWLPRGEEVPHPAAKKKRQQRQTDPLTALLAANEFNRMWDLLRSAPRVRYGWGVGRLDTGGRAAKRLLRSFESVE